MSAKNGNKGKVNKNNIYKKQCESCPHIIEYRDKPNEFGNLKFRAVYVFLSFWVLGFNQSVGISFFTSLLMFTVPLFYDLVKFTPIERSRRLIKYFSLSFLFIHILVAALGMLGIIECIEKNSLLYIIFSSKNLAFQGLGIKLSIFWLSILGEVILSWADTIVAIPFFSKIQNNSLEAN